jgi:hypothetical protein
MSYIYLIAIRDDPSIISCYQKGDRVRVDNSDKLSLPPVATKCSNDTTFNLRNLDHFSFENEFYNHAAEIGLLEQSSDGMMLAQQVRIEEKEGTSWWVYAAAAGLVAAAAVGGYKYYESNYKPVTKKSWMDHLNPWYKPPPTLGQRMLTGFQNATKAGLDGVVRVSPFPKTVTLNMLETALCPPNRLPYSATQDILNNALDHIATGYALRKQITES